MTIPNHPSVPVAVLFTLPLHLAAAPAAALAAGSPADPASPAEPGAEAELPAERTPLSSFFVPPASQGAAAEEQPAGPWRLSKALGLPEWIRISGEQRTRYESLWNDFRANDGQDTDIWALRTLLRFDLQFDPVEAALELIDSRAYGVDEGDPINTTIVDPIDVLQLYAGVRLGDLFGEGNEGFLLFGRHTMDIGTRRLVARNDFRNTINAFTGLNATWETKSGSFLRLFAVAPVFRQPDEFTALEDNEVEADDEAEDTLFYGAYASTKEIVPGVAGELYWYYLDEDDADDQATSDRSIHTPGFRVHRKPEPSEFGFEVEAAYQFGDSRSGSSASNTTDLDHSAWFAHAEVGYGFPGEWKPQLAAQFDYASGDDDPEDDENNRFDTLFGARRFDFGPTGIFGAFARSNIISPGLRLTLKPSAKVDLMLVDRWYWLASDTDAWTTAGVRDPSGDSGSYVGNMPEIRLRWHVVPKNILFDTGFAYLFTGSFVDEAPNGTGEDSTYAYAQVTFTF